MEFKREYNLPQIIQLDFVQNVKPLLDHGGYYIGQDQKIHRHFIEADYNGPWSYKNIQGTPDYLNCLKWHQVLFSCFNCIPKECFNCYKVVVRPRNVLELLKLDELQEETTFPCKCGIEERDYVEALYGGYFYTNSLELGRERYKEVRKLVDENISPDVSVYLKRACTEYELKFGKSNAWEYNPNEKYYSQWIDKNFDPECFRNDFKAPDYIKLDVIARWLKYAAQNGDHSYRELTNGEPMFDEPITYHEGE